VPLLCVLYVSVPTGSEIDPLSFRRFERLDRFEHR
jgi:hypothetical protein